jgi:hypothetical protein
MADHKEQKICIKFSFNLEKTASETYKMLKKPFGDDTTSRTQTFKWYSHFRRGQTSVEEF